MTAPAQHIDAAALDDLLQAQRAAIEESGVAEGFHFLQVRNPAFWVYVWSLVAGVAHLLGFYLPNIGNFGGALAAGTVAFGVYCALWLLFLHWLDRFAPLPASVLVVGFIWGAVTATTFIALTVNGATLSIYGKLFGPTWVRDWGAGFTAPITEETAKAIGFVLLLGLAPKLFRSAFDGFVAGAFIGLGFEVAEDILYVFNGAANDFGTNQIGNSVQITAMRMASGLVSHAMFTALVCAGIMWILGRDPRGRHVVKGLGLIVIAMAFHFFWDDAGAIGGVLPGAGAGLALMPMAIAAGVAVVLIVGLDSAKSERAWSASILEPEVAAGTLTRAEADAITGTHRHRKKFIRSIQGHHQRKGTKLVLAAGQDLTVAIGRDAAAETDAVQLARAEIARVRAR